MNAEAPAANPASERPDNPYVGPRAFRRGELYFGRERETAGLVDTLLASRIVLLHSPSGAGKTSLIQAALAPTLEARNFQLCARVRPSFSAVRVNAPAPEKYPVDNRYVHSLVLGLVGHLDHDPAELGRWTVSQALDELARQPGAPTRQVLVIDQFEEILTLDPTDQEGQRVFFRQVGEALDEPNRWALFAMREDFMGGLDRYLRYIPGQFRATFRLDLLDSEGALRAIRQPAAERGIDFHADAAQALVEDLRQVSVESPETGVIHRPGSYVEPVLLQVVCDGLWRTLTEEYPDSFDHIDTQDVQNYGPLNTALSRYYRTVVEKAAKRSGSPERAIRDWVQEKLLTEQEFRGQTRTKPPVANPDEALRYLSRRYLVREDPRAGVTWWELSHDRLIEPVLDDNRRWRELKLPRWQRKAYDWSRAPADDKSRHLLGDREYRAARVSSRKLTLTPTEEAFLDASGQVFAEEGRLRRIRSLVGVLQGLLIASLAVNAVTLYLLLT